MKSLELTEEHKFKLLEMCKVLFPECVWGFGDFYSSEVVTEYNGLDYLDITHINHKIPNLIPRFELDRAEIDTKNLIVVEKSNQSPMYDKIQYGFVNNIEPLKSGFMITHEVHDDGGYDYSKPIIKQHSSYEEGYVEGIHWFEFCMINLFNELLKKNYINAPAFYISILGKQHPVDYIYEQFKKLK